MKYLSVLILLFVLTCKTHTAKAIEIYSKFEEEFFINTLSQYELIQSKNPFYTEDIQLIVEFTHASKKKIIIHGFYSEDYNVISDSAKHHYLYKNLDFQKFSPKIAQSWKVRFTPTLIGDWNYVAYFFLPQEKKKIHCSSGSFTCTNSNKNYGFITLKNNDHFEFSSGKGFIPIGFNIATFPEFGEYAPKINFYEKYFMRLHQHGANAIRIWFNWTGGQFLIGTNGGKCMNYHDRFNMEYAYMFDSIIALAEKYEIKLMVNIFTVNEFMQDTRWEHNNLYNKNVKPYSWCSKQPYTGGMCIEKFDYITNKEAVAHQNNVIRYILNRWGYSTSIYTWQIFNEADFLPFTSVKKYVNWHKDKYNFIKKYDAYNRPVIASFAGGYSDWGQAKDIITLQEKVFKKMDYVSYHRYTNQFNPRADSLNTVPASVFNEMQNGKEKYKKPIFIDECGNMNYLIKEYEEIDPQAYAYHQSAWISIFTGIAGTSFDWLFHSFLNRHSTEMEASNYLKTLESISKYIHGSIPLEYLGCKDFKQTFYFTDSLYVFVNNNTVKNEYYGYILDYNYRFEHFIINKKDKLLNEYIRSFAPELKPQFASKTFALSLPVKKPGFYTIIWFSTETGEKIFESTLPTETFLFIDIPTNLISKFGDVAFKIVPM